MSDENKEQTDTKIGFNKQASDEAQKQAETKIEFYNQVSDEYSSFADAEKKTDYYLRVRDLESLIRAYAPREAEFEDLVVLDFGCGSGGVMRHLRKLGIRNLTGIDINDEFLKSASEKDPSGEYIKIEAGAPVPLPDARFDLIISSYVICELSRLEAVAQMFEEMSRMLRPGGFAIVITIHKDYFTPGFESVYTSTAFPENFNVKSGSLVKTAMKQLNMVFDDYYWSDEDIIEQAAKAKLELAEIHCPLGKDEDGVDWISEKTTKITAMFIFKKSASVE